MTQPRESKVIARGEANEQMGLPLQPQSKGGTKTMGTTQVVFLGHSGLDDRFARAVFQGDLPDHDYFLPILTLNRKGELVDLAQKEGYDLVRRDPLDFLLGLPAEERWEAEQRRIFKLLSEDCMSTLDFLQNTPHTPINLDDSAPLPECLIARNGTGMFSPIRASCLIGRALEKVDGREDLPPWRIQQAQDLSHCLIHMEDCFCTIHPFDYTVPGYVLPFESVNVKDEDAFMFIVDIHR
jgi:hypothetical protein